MDDAEDVSELFIARIRALRENSGLTQRQMAASSEDFSLGQIQRLETHKRDIKLWEAKALADYWHTTVASLIGEELPAREGMVQLPRELIADIIAAVEGQM